MWEKIWWDNQLWCFLHLKHNRLCVDNRLFSRHNRLSVKKFGGIIDYGVFCT